MTTFDYGILAIIGVSVLLSLMRGFLREMIGLVAWLVAFYVAQRYSVEVAPLLPQTMPNESLRMLAAFAAVFLCALLVTSLLGISLYALVRNVGLGPFDRTLGVFFGLARGILIVGVLVLLGGMTSLPERNDWRNAMFSAPLEAMVLWCKPWLPTEITDHLKY
jgi:membrane protein required for colicin V production